MSPPLPTSKAFAQRFQQFPERVVLACHLIKIHLRHKIGCVLDSPYLWLETSIEHSVDQKFFVSVTIALLIGGSTPLPQYLLKGGRIQ